MTATEAVSIKKYMVGVAVLISGLLITQTVGLLRWTAIIETRVSVNEREIRRLRDRLEGNVSGSLTRSSADQQREIQ